MSDFVIDSIYFTLPKICLEANFLAGFQSSDRDIQELVNQALKILVRDYRRCGYTSDWFRGFLLALSKQLHKYSNDPNQNANQFVRYIWMNDPIILEKLNPEIDAYQQCNWIDRIFQRIILSFL